MKIEENTSAKKLHKLAIEDIKGDITFEIVTHKNVSQKTLKFLSVSENEDIRFAVLLSNKTSVEILKELKNDRSARIRSFVANHKNATIEIFNEILNDIYFMKVALRYIYKHKNVTKKQKIDILKELSASEKKVFKNF